MIRFSFEILLQIKKNGKKGYRRGCQKNFLKISLDAQLFGKIMFSRGERLLNFFPIT